MRARSAATKEIEKTRQSLNTQHRPFTGNALNPKYPGGAEAQKALPEAEGHTVAQRGRKNVRLYVSGYEQALAQLQKEQDGDLK